MPSDAPTSNGRSAALDVLLTDAAFGNPAVRLVSEPVGAARTVAAVAAHPRRLARRGGSLAREIARVARGSSEVAPPKGDRRFADPAWERSWYFRCLAQAYLVLGDTLEGLIDDADLDWQADTTARFAAANLRDFLAPTNFPWSNPAVLRRPSTRAAPTSSRASGAPVATSARGACRRWSTPAASRWAATSPSPRAPWSCGPRSSS